MRPFIHCLYSICDRKFYARTHEKITRQWTSTLKLAVQYNVSVELSSNAHLESKVVKITKSIWICKINKAHNESSKYITVFFTFSVNSLSNFKIYFPSFFSLSPYFGTPPIVSIQMTHHHPDLGSASENLPHDIRSTTQIKVVTRHQCGISALVSLTSFGGKPFVESRNDGCFLRLFIFRRCTWALVGVVLRTLHNVKVCKTSVT